MAIALYPYAGYSCYINGGPVALIENDIVSADFCAVTIQFNVSVQLTGTTFVQVVSYTPVSTTPIVKEVAIDPIQTFQSMTFVTNSAVLLMTVRARSDSEADTGVVLMWSLSSLVQGSNETDSTQKQISRINKQAIKNAYRLRAYPCICRKCVANVIAQYTSCPIITGLTSGSTQTSGNSQYTFNGTGNNLIFLTPWLSNYPMIRLIKRVTFAQESVQLEAVPTFTSSFVFTVTFNVPSSSPGYVAGTAILTFVPTNPTCAPIVRIITITDSSSSLPQMNFAARRRAANTAFVEASPATAIATTAGTLKTTSDGGAKS